jgi:hypothetical protein
MGAEPAEPGSAKAGSAPPAASAADEAAAADHAASPPSHYGKPDLKTHPTEIAVIRGRGGRKTLAIEYPWKAHQNASVEVRLVPAERAEGTFVTPLDFYGQFLSHGAEKTSYNVDLQAKIYRCLDHAEEGLTETFAKDRMGFKIVGRRNSLGHPSVYVLAYNEGKTPEDRADVVFPQLDTWAVADNRLSLDLPPEVFARPGKLFVWFLRGDRLLWEEQVDWPGAAAK